MTFDTHYPLLPLDAFREAMGYHPFHFWGLVNATVRVDSACNGLVYKHAWQGSNQAGREDILRSISIAEDKIRDYLGYSPAPHYVEEIIPWPKYHDPSVRRVGFLGAEDRFVGVRLNEGKIIQMGLQTFEFLGTVAVTYSDSDGDTVEDRWVTASLATSVTDTSEIYAFFSSADRLETSDPIGPEYRIQPIRTTISGGNVVVRGRKWLLVKPTKYEGVNLNDVRNGLDPNAAANFVTTIDLYRVYIDPNGETTDTSQATLYWETTPCTGWWCCSSSLPSSLTANILDPASVGTAVARAGIRDALMGVVTPAQALRDASSGIWASTGWEWWREPDRVKVRYWAGEALTPNNEMSTDWRFIVARMAAAELGGRICACDQANAELWQWQFDLSRAAGVNSEQYQIAPEDLKNPFGTRRGQVYAWKKLKALAVQRSLSF